MNKYPEPLLFTTARSPAAALPIYLWIVAGWALLGRNLMRKAKTRWPRLGKGGLVALVFVSCWMADLVVESSAIALGFFSYPGAHKSLSLWPNTYYQFPLWEPFFWGSLQAVWACIAYFRNDKGESLAERGTHTLKISAKGKTAVRFLALTGACNLAFFAVYTIPMWVISVHTETWTSDVVQNRSYLVNDLCGPRTDYACPGPGRPIARKDSAHLGPDGSLRVPEGTNLPDED